MAFGLRVMGCSEFVAVDNSGEMLNQARKKDVYKEFHLMDLGETLDFADDSFDAVVCAGVLTFSHVPARSLHELVRVTKPGGHIEYSLRDDAFQSMGFDSINSRLESEKKWQLVEKEGHQSFTRKNQDVIHDIRVYKIL